MEVAAHLPQVATSGDRPDVGRVRDVVDAARDLGLAAVCANDHLTFHRPWLDGPTLLAAVADRAGGMDLATTVALPSLRGPAQLAAALTTLATLAPGRVRRRRRAPARRRRTTPLAGVPFDDRWPQFEESLRVLRGLLGGGSLPARWVEILDGSRQVEPPAPVPIWVASWGSPAGLRRVARWGDGWLASAYNTSPEAFAEGRRRLAHERARLGRPDLPAAVATMWTWVTDDPADARAGARRRAGAARQARPGRAA